MALRKSYKYYYLRTHLSHHLAAICPYSRKAVSYKKLKCKLLSVLMVIKSLWFFMYFKVLDRWQVHRIAAGGRGLVIGGSRACGTHHTDGPPPAPLSAASWVRHTSSVKRFQFVIYRSHYRLDHTGINSWTSISPLVMYLFVVEQKGMKLVR